MLITKAIQKLCNALSRYMRVTRCTPEGNAHCALNYLHSSGGCTSPLVYECPEMVL
jgi:hypothetical protein